jgi:hypothetical protein
VFEPVNENSISISTKPFEEIHRCRDCARGFSVFPIKVAVEKMHAGKPVRVSPLNKYNRDIEVISLNGPTAEKRILFRLQLSCRVWRGHAFADYEKYLIAIKAHPFIKKSVTQGCNSFKGKRLIPSFLVIASADITSTDKKFVVAHLLFIVMLRSRKVKQSRNARKRRII